jgi:hypothetical protein
MLVASVAEAKKPSRGILQWLAPSLRSVGLSTRYL